MPTIKNLAVLAKSKGPEARAAEEVRIHALAGRFRHAPGLGWFAWDGRRWEQHPSNDGAVLDAVRGFADQTQRQWAQDAETFRQMIVDVLAPLVAAASGMSTAEAGSLVKIAIGGGKLAGMVKEHGGSQQQMLTGLARQMEEALDQADVWLNLLSATALKHLVTLAQGMDGVLTRHEAFDAHPDLLNVQNGTLDLRTGELLGHDPELLLTKLARAEYHAGATCPVWKAALGAIHPELSDWLPVRIGQSATGHEADDDALFVSIGGGANGKTTILDGVKRVLGDYAGLIPHKALMDTATSHSTELMTFRGLRMAVLEETPEDGHLDMHRVKTVTGSGQITARAMRQDNVTFDTTHTTWINTNHRPRVSGADHGTWRRLAAVPWPYTFVAPGADRPDEWHVEGDRTLRPAVVTPSPETAAAILAWIVAGAQQWYAADRVSPPHPPAVLAATLEWRMTSDHALSFVRERLVESPGSYITGEDMRAEFGAHLEEQGARATSAAKMNERLTGALASRGVAAPFEQARVKATNTRSTVPGDVRAEHLTPGTKTKAWWGVRFRTPADDAADRLRTGGQDAA